MKYDFARTVSTLIIFISLIGLGLSIIRNNPIAVNIVFLLFLGIGMIARNSLRIDEQEEKLNKLLERFKTEDD